MGIIMKKIVLLFLCILFFNCKKVDNNINKEPENYYFQKVIKAKITEKTRDGHIYLLAFTDASCKEVDFGIYSNFNENDTIWFECNYNHFYYSTYSYDKNK